MRPKREQEIAAVLALDAMGRFKHFIKRVVDEERAWGLRKGEGWALLGHTDGTELFPLWPAREYAKLCAEGEFADFEPSEITLDEILEWLIPTMDEKRTRPAIFPTPKLRAAIVSTKDLHDAIRTEMAEWYGE